MLTPGPPNLVLLWQSYANGALVMESSSNVAIMSTNGLYCHTGINVMCLLMFYSLLRKKVMFCQCVNLKTKR